ncbi:von Willebrand factor A domain-containing protein 7-like [Alosa sapidissima]|uniref:von Willebrand factor A domain-containing protein 7-like n=1 Tax=Alosa sapidissima TaxID=34773 RepID=UPI001C088B90|nr:von Willebrand factor A domain-containing protein 7-like [Alosa sapidissima]
MALMLWACCAALLVLTLCGTARAFMPVGEGSSTHATITGNAVLSKITEVCQAVAESEGREFKPTGSSAEELLRACLGSATGEVSAAQFRSALNQIYMQNGLVDRDLANSPAHHANNEAFVQARTLITEGTVSVKANVRTENFQAAREMLGRACHTLQDFYSHSNWVELGNRDPYPPLLQPHLPMDNIADIDTPTCSDCASGTCPNPLLPDILAQKKLTSGYMGLLSADKPKGKCSHGGASDLTSTQVPRGGISKDERRPDNAALHDTAVTMATQATMVLLEDIRGATGNKDFLRLMGIARSAVLCFVIDTTGSMADDIAEAQSVATQIIDSKKGTADEPSEYVLVQFNDPKFGPLVRTADPEVMKAEISALTANGGGDMPEMCLSGLQLALTGAPPSSQIYVFTDAPAKDMSLEKTIIALIRSTKSTVNIFMTANRKVTRRSLGPARLPRADFRVYYDLALASGGQAIEVAKASLPQATEIIVDSTTSALVTILQRARNPGAVETFSFLLDESVSNVTLYITGTSTAFTLRNPTGVSQSSTQTAGPLGTIQTVGNLKRVRLNTPEQTGLWEIHMNTREAYTVKVTGQSAITFVYNFVETFEGPHPGYGVIDGRPQAGSPTKLLLTLTGPHGPETLKVLEAALVEVSGSGLAGGTVQEMGGGNFLVSVNSAPAGEFVVLLKGEDTSTSSQFHRQSTTQMSLTPVSVKIVVDTSMEPGKAINIPFSITSSETGTTFNIQATNDKNFAMKYPSSITSGSSVEAKGTLTITAPSGIASGTDVTLTINAESSRTHDSNYAVVRLSVMKKVTDFTPPVCNVVNVNNTCADDCSSASWDVSVDITDGNGTGVERVWVQQGDSDLISESTTGPGAGVTVIHRLYRTSCCTPDLKLSVTDKEGNVGSCSHSIKLPTTTPVPPTTTAATTMAVPPTTTTATTTAATTTAATTTTATTTTPTTTTATTTAVPPTTTTATTTAVTTTTPSGGPPSISLATPLWFCLLLSATAIVRDLLPVSL